jgi:hypothetical protein
MSETNLANAGPGWLGSHLRFFYVPFWSNTGTILYNRCGLNRFLFLYVPQQDHDSLSLWSSFCHDLNFYMCNSIKGSIVVLPQREPFLFDLLLHLMGTYSMSMVIGGELN